MAGLFGIIDRNRIVQEAESLIMAESPPTQCSGGSHRTCVQRFSDIPALENVSQ